MPDHPRTERLAESVLRAGVIPDEETPRFEQLRAEFQDPDGLAREMVRRDWLTAYQAEKLLEGKPDDLTLGPYVLMDLLGEGGMGRVYKARHRLMNRVVALKVIRADLLRLGEARQRFLREIEAAARVWHPNLVTARDAAPIGESYVLVMEYVEGKTLAGVLQSAGVPPIRHACDWVRQAALGLHHAHEQGLIHRDLKPSNLLLTSKGNVVKVMDLGLARFELLGERGPDDEPLTESGVVIGTPDYLAPEQAVAPRSADARADIYSLGCTLYHLLTGRPPFPGGSLTQKLLWHQNADPPDPVRLRPSVPPELSHAVLKMMAKLPEQRYATAAEVASALAAFVSATGLKTLHAPEVASGDPAAAHQASPTRVTPIARREPRDSTAYDLVDPPVHTPTASPVDEPGPTEESAPPLSKPALPGDDSWWKDEVDGRPPDEGRVVQARPSHPAGPRSNAVASAPSPKRSGTALRIVIVAVALTILAAGAWALVALVR